MRIGIDLGGTKVEAIALDAHGGERLRRRVPTPANSVAAIVDTIAGLVRDFEAELGVRATVGVGTPGAVSPATGVLKNSNTTCLIGQPITRDLETLLGRAVAMQNDANCFAMAEALDGAGKGHDLVFGVIMGTGCGGGIVNKGEVINGLMSIGGEWGHMSIDPNGPLCYCGMRGCVETYISGGRAADRWADQHGAPKPLGEIVTDYRAGEPKAAAFMQEFFRNFGRALANLINILDPDIVVLGGGVANIDELYTEGVKQVEHFVFSDGLETPIVRHQLGDSAGVIGAALIGI